MFSIDSIQELIDKNKSKIIKELDMKTLDIENLSKEDECLLQVLDYSPKTLYSEKEIMNSLPIIKLKPLNQEKKQPIKNKHLKLVSSPNIDMDSLALKSNNNLRTSLISNNFENNEKKSDKEEKEEKKEKKEEKEEKKEEKKESNDDEDDEEFERQFAIRQRQIEEREKKRNNYDDEDDFKDIHHKMETVPKKKN